MGFPVSKGGSAGADEELHPDVQWLVGLLPPDADLEAARWEHYSLVNGYAASRPARE